MLGFSTRGDTGRAVSTVRAFPLAVTVTASTNAADTANARRRREHIQMDADLFRQMKAAGLIVLNNQVVLTIGSYKCPLTVEILEYQSAILTVRIGTEAATRLGATLPAAGMLSAYAPDNPVDDAAAQAAGQYYESKTDNGSNTVLIVIAPHGGNIEADTDTLATAAKTALDAATPNAKATSLWIGKGYGIGGQSSYDRHHISTVDTCIALNPVLDTLDTRGWSYCIAFHGQSTNSRIDIGCPTAQNAFVDTLVTALQGDAALAGVTIARSSDTVEIAGSDLNNLGNRLAASHYIQLEIGPNVRASSSMRSAIISKLATAYGAL
jgi:phage replication-related protein YjqB (UPF0714/DUF867 family)